MAPDLSLPLARRLASVGAAGQVKRAKRLRPLQRLIAHVRFCAAAGPADPTAPSIRAAAVGIARLTGGLSAARAEQLIEDLERVARRSGE